MEAKNAADKIKTLVKRGGNRLHESAERARHAVEEVAVKIVHAGEETAQKVINRAKGACQQGRPPRPGARGQARRQGQRGPALPEGSVRRYRTCSRDQPEPPYPRAPSSSSRRRVEHSSSGAF